VSINDFGECANPGCNRDAMSNSPKMCATHTLVLFGMMGSLFENQLRDAFLCPYMDWAVSSNGMDPDGVEAAIEDHLNEYHPGWTVEQLEQLLKEGGETE
jgi:hypothetical protein